jgi:hypothetical protein
MTIITREQLMDNLKIYNGGAISGHIIDYLLELLNESYNEGRKDTKRARNFESANKAWESK